MITRIEALNYRCLRSVQQDLKPFQILVGANGSGKSSFLDVPVLMGDMVRDGLEPAISRRAPDYSYLFWLRSGDRFKVAIEAQVPEERRAALLAGIPQIDRYSAWRYLLEKQPPISCRYELSIGRVSNALDELCILEETVSLCLAALDPNVKAPVPSRGWGIQEPAFFPGNVVGDRLIVLFKRPPTGSGPTDQFYAENGTWAAPFNLGHRKSALANLPDDEGMFPVTTWFRRHLLAQTRRIVLDNEAIRAPSPRGSTDTLRPDGANLPWLIEQMDPARRSQWLRHVQTVLPDLRDITTFLREEDNTRYVKLHYTNGAEVRSWLVSDGTLRLLALTLLPYLPSTKCVYLIEEPENTIHPTAIEAVLDSLRSVYDGQVIVATHSPVILGLADLGEVLCFSKADDGSTQVVPGKEHRVLRNWRGEVNLGVLFASGVLSS